MYWLLVIVALSFGVLDASKAFDDDASIVAASQADDNNTGTERRTSDDVDCTKIDDVAAARWNLCPAQCDCGPPDGQELHVFCYGTRHTSLTL